MYRFKQLILLGGDLIAFFCAFLCSLSLRHLEIPDIEIITSNLSLFFFVFLLWIVINYINGLYDLKLIHAEDRYKRIFGTALFSFIAGVAFFYILPSRNITPKTILILTVILGYLLAAGWRGLYNVLIGDKKLKTRILFLGYTKEVEELLAILKKEPNTGYEACVIIDPEQKIKAHDHEHVDVYHNLTALRPSITTKNINTIVTAPHLDEKEDVMREMYELLFWSANIVDLTSFYETITGRIPPATFSESWFIKNIRNTERPVYNKFRRLIDIFSAACFGVIFIILSPILIPSIKYTSKGPIFFKQKRTGKGEVIFWMYKLRTMYALSKDGSAETQGAQFAKKDDERITWIGKFLRKSRLDELPQAWNLLRGDITLIGPRPERPEIVEKLVDQMAYYPLRHTVKPGITGWAAVHQHYTDTLETSLQKLQYDLFYIKNRSFIMDLSIVLKTIRVVLRGMGQ
ncbi:hypothetical protein C0581_01175 [Candidatus Parcubacteria bacterium]|nr:MAG: hypothetical protein C0581_01175 [Candidatus Parcubacteria bacterium]